MIPPPEIITIQIPASPQLIDLIKNLLSNGAGVTIATGTGAADEMISLRQAAGESRFSYSLVRRWVVDESRIPFSRPSGAPRGKILIRRGDLLDFLKSSKSAPTPSPGRPRLSTRIPIL